MRKAPSNVVENLVEDRPCSGDVEASGSVGFAEEGVVQGPVPFVEQFVLDARGELYRIGRLRAHEFLDGGCEVGGACAVDGDGGSFDRSVEAGGA